MWAQFYYLLSVASLAEPSITEQDWLAKARIFGKNFVTIYSAEDVTPYCHVFIYHLGFYLEKYGSVEKFANYAIECRVRFNKRLITTATNGFSRLQSTYNVTFQEIDHSWREDKYFLEHPELHTFRKRARRDGWSDKTMAAYTGEPPSFHSVTIAPQVTVNEPVTATAEPQREVSAEEKRKVS